MIFFPLHTGTAGENFSLSQQYLQAPLSHSNQDTRLVTGSCPFPSWIFSHTFLEVQETSLEALPESKTGKKKNHCFLATFLFLYFPRQQLHFLSQHSIDNSFSKHSSHTMDASCHVPTLLLSACSQQSRLWQLLREFLSCCLLCRAHRAQPAVTNAVGSTQQL